MEIEKASIMVVDDDPGILHSANMFLKQVFSDITVSGSPDEMIKRIQEEQFDTVLLDMNFTRGEIDGKEGIGLLQQIHEIDPDLPVIFITAYGDFDLAAADCPMDTHHGRILVHFSGGLYRPWKQLFKAVQGFSRHGKRKFRQRRPCLSGF